jgi:hypothetical protein
MWSSILKLTTTAVSRNRHTGFGDVDVTGGRHDGNVFDKQSVGTYNCMYEEFVASWTFRHPGRGSDFHGTPASGDDASGVGGSGGSESDDDFDVRAWWSGTVAFDVAQNFEGCPLMC